MDLAPEDARVALEICDRMQGTLTPEDVVKIIRMANYLTPRLEEAFDAAGIDADDMDLPEMPLLRPGDLHQPGT